MLCSGGENSGLGPHHVVVAFSSTQLPSRQRLLTPNQLEQLKKSLSSIKNDIPPFEVLSGRDPEMLSYADNLMKAFKADGLKIMHNGKDQEVPEPTDIYSPGWKGVVIVVKYRDAPIHPAVLLYQALQSAEIDATFISYPSGDDNTLFLIVGLK